MNNPLPIPAEEIQKLTDVIGRVIDADADGTTPVVRIHQNTKLMALERFRQRPTFMQRSIEFGDAEEFIRYCSEFGGVHSAGFASLRPLVVDYVIDYGRVNEPQWAAHRAHFKPAISPQWAAWQKRNRTPMTHREFAEFIEEHLKDITAPEAAAMLEMITSFSASGTQKFASGIRLQSGDVQLQYSHEVRGASKSGQVEIPPQFVILIPLYEFHEYVSLIAHLRYRLQEGELRIWYEFLRLDEVLAGHDLQLLNKIRTEVPRVSVGRITYSVDHL